MRVHRCGILIDQNDEQTGMCIEIVPKVGEENLIAALLEGDWVSTDDKDSKLKIVRHEPEQ